MIVDFILPTFNRDKELKSSLYSLLAQTNPNWTAHVMIDNNDPPMIGELIVFGINDPRITYSYMDKRYND